MKDLELCVFEISGKKKVIKEADLAAAENEDNSSEMRRITKSSTNIGIAGRQKSMLYDGSHPPDMGLFVISSLQQLLLLTSLISTKLLQS